MTPLSTGLLQKNHTTWIKNNQSHLYQLLVQSLKKQRLSHAYLIVGQKDLLEIVNWIASLIQIQSDDENQLNEQVNRIMNSETIDVQILDGSKESIKKESIIQLQHQFSQSAKEVTGQKVAILHHVENASSQALNALLKSIEEPSGDHTTYLLTTNNMSMVLPTIISRCVILETQESHQQELISSYEKMGISHLSAYSLSTLTSNETLAKELLETLELEKLSDLVLDFIEEIQHNIDLGCVHFQLNHPNDRDAIKIVFQMMAYQFKINHLIELREIALNTLSKINRSVSVALLVDEFCANVKENLS